MGGGYDGPGYPVCESGSDPFVDVDGHDTTGKSRSYGRREGLRGSTGGDPGDYVGVQRYRWTSLTPGREPRGGVDTGSVTVP